ncbi:hypothetical protein [Hyalangium sp.]|uniref:hypothetical protein n=1 Tax=Hyalangium sp. TaxID=2028555 RepID=UPI002D221688|nr:hypothetical protein [Hyalangium sp.]HYH97408.1 hypothetical protein [Hyalangium sp.]
MSEGAPPNSGDNKVYPERKLPRPIEEVRAQLMADPDVREQARLLDVPVPDYVERIIDYATHPEKPPQVWVLPDEELKARDPNIPTVDEVKTHLEKIVSGEIAHSPAHMPDGYSDDRSQERYQAALGTSEAPKGAPEGATVPDQGSNPEKGSAPKS